MEPPTGQSEILTENTGEKMDFLEFREDLIT